MHDYIIGNLRNSYSFIREFNVTDNKNPEAEFKSSLEKINESIKKEIKSAEEN